MTVHTEFSKNFHDSPPTFTSQARQRFLYIDEPFKELVLSKIRDKSNKVFATTAYKYFKLTNQFFSDANKKDLNYIAKQLGINFQLDWQSYNKDSKRTHQHLILDFLGITAFTPDKLAPDILLDLENDARVQRPFKQCFIHIANKLKESKTEIPSYEALEKIIVATYKNHETNLRNTVNDTLDEQSKLEIDKLFAKSSHDVASQTYKLTLLKRFSHSPKPQQIAKNIEAFDTLHEMFLTISPVLKTLNLNVEGLRHYAQSVNKGQIFQTLRKTDDNRYLQLVCFIAHQYYTLQDVLVDTLIIAVTASFNMAERLAKEQYYKTRHAQSDNVRHLLNSTQDVVETLSKFNIILTDPTVSDAEKIDRLTRLVATPQESTKNIDITIRNVENDLDTMSGEALLYHFLSIGSRKLQLRCNKIIERLSFSEQSAAKPLLDVIDKFKKSQTVVDETFPIGFMTSKEANYVDSKETFNSQLYKVILFKHVVDAIKGDGLSLVHSYKHKALDEYLIPKSLFDANFAEYLERAEMTAFADCDAYLANLDLDLHAQYQETNSHILEDVNDYIKTDGLGGFKLAAYRRNVHDEFDLDPLTIPLFPDNERITLSQVLSTVDNACGFLDELQHYSGKSKCNRPNRKTMIAAIVGTGCHFSPHKFSKLCDAINNSSLTTALNNYLSVNGTRLACDSIEQFVEKMPLSSIYLDNDKVHTSSDGQKYPVAGDSLNAHFSFKYGGKERVLSAYTFIDCRNLFFHSTVISGAEREAHYMIDGVLRNEVVKSDMHSTDTHGFAEMISGVAHLLNITFAPRIKNLHRQQLYSIRGKKTYSHANYKLLPDKKIDMKHIKENWREMLRAVVSIKLGEATASQVFKRLNSYSASNNPLYTSLKEFGRITKSHYILRYVDSLELRQAVQKQLNKGESGNKLDRALAIGRAEYVQTTREEQEVVESCKRLIKNAIVCWNYMYLTQKLMSLQSKDERRAFVEKIRRSSTVAWEHIIIHGAFDFSESKLKDSHGFDFDKMLDPKIFREIDDE